MGLTPQQQEIIRKNGNGHSPAPIAGIKHFAFITSEGNAFPTIDYQPDQDRDDAQVVATGEGRTAQEALHNALRPGYGVGEGFDEVGAYELVGGPIHKQPQRYMSFLKSGDEERSVDSGRPGNKHYMIVAMDGYDTTDDNGADVDNIAVVAFVEADNIDDAEERAIEEADLLKYDVDEIYIVEYRERAGTFSIKDERQKGRK